MVYYSKWSKEFIDQFKETKTLRNLKNEINDSTNKEKRKREIDKTITDILKGKYKRKG